MKTSLLFQRIKSDLESYREKVKSSHDQGSNSAGDIHDTMSHIHDTMSQYNWDNFQEIMNLSPDNFNGEVDVNDLNDMETRIDHYFQLYGSSDDEFKKFIK